MIRVLHIIAGLAADGAERTMLQLISSMNPAHFTQAVMSLTGLDALGPSLAEAGVPVQALEMRKTPAAAATLPRLVHWIRRSRPDVVQTWMYHADLIGGLAARAAGRWPVLWNIRHSRLDPKVDKPTTIAIARVCARFSGVVPRHIVCCSHASLGAHIAMGYDAGRMLVLPNGFDTERFQRSADARLSLRRELELADEDIAIGRIARYHPVKDHATFLAAAARVYQANPRARFVLCGEGVEWKNRELAHAIQDAGIRSACRLLGPRTDMARVYSCLDFAVSSSSSEGFPNAIGEAMACQVPAVVTDVGDSAYLVAGSGKIVQPFDPEALAQACLGLMEAGTDARWFLGSLARQRIEQRFSLSAVVERYQALYASVATEWQAKRFPHPATAR